MSGLSLRDECSYILTKYSISRRSEGIKEKRVEEGE
jgi:hypothetical protein